MATQEIGIPIDLTVGVFDKLIYKNNALQLIDMATDDNLNPVFVDSGTWISEPIWIKDKITSFKRVSKTINVKGNGSYKIFTSSSPDQTSWSPWEEINYVDGSITSPPDHYAKIKIEVFAQKANAIFTVDEFNIPDKYSNPFINSSDGILELKTQYPLVGTQDMNWNDPGKLFITRINKSNFKAINKIEVI
ncbi:hypothetical protein SAMN04488688_10626 [Paenibacillus sp. cl141a]|uniref:hypothetical protein n=1 Tax=Paenibacillus sp. cl141a TaxID=1761877 RepID=UPI0008BA16DC|nr:hypothetical protein [Paenibacillus sp. cl141a]SEL81171.1 hypothetical protein SAMN04488688_10626 [Paenibacillus sp. cl141a]